MVTLPMPQVRWSFSNVSPLKFRQPIVPRGLRPLREDFTAENAEKKMNSGSSSAISAVKSSTVSVDGKTGTIGADTTLFDFAESLGITVPTSCIKQGKCRECLLEIESGAEFLTPPTPQESHLSGRFRLACRTRIATPGEVKCHTLRRGS